MSSDTTNIFDLPIDPLNGGNVSNNITLSASENISVPQNGGGVSLDQTTITQIVNGIQQASTTGATKLPSRDIPINTSSIMNDPYIQPNYVPRVQEHADYIKDMETNEEIIYNYNKQIQNNNSLDDMYNEIQTPLLLSVLYFLFQLPFFRRFLFSYLPSLFSNDGNYNINGFLFCSILFGLLFYILNKVTNHFNVF